MKLAAILVAYNPNVEEVIKNLRTYSDIVEVSILWDNSTSSQNHWSSVKKEMPELIVIAEGGNIGLGAAYNKGIEIALQNGCTHIMTMDQDSTFVNFALYREQSALLIDQHGITCPPINSPNIPKNDNQIKSHAAQSGCIFSLDMIKKIGMFREDFFIGMVDVEMQLKAAENGYSILQIGGCNLIHHIGSERSVSILGHHFQVSDYSPLRHYYDSRNRILMWREFPYDYSMKGKIKHFKGRLSVCLRILLAENNKWRKIYSIFRGTFNGLTNRILPY